MHFLKDIRRFVDMFCKLAAPKDAGELKKINLGKLRQTTPQPPDVEPREFYQGLNEQALEGPVFQMNTIEYIENLHERFFPKNNRKQFTKWLANVLQAGQRWPGQNDLMSIVDYLNAVDVNFDAISYDELKELSENWHTQEFEVKIETGAYATKNVVHDFGNGYTMVKVPPEDLGVEGDKMGHCVGSYCEYVNKGEGEIFSLRDAKNEPHVTIRTAQRAEHTVKIDEIKGKENKAPIDKYAVMVREWLDHLSNSGAIGDYKTSEDYLNIARPEDLVDIIYGGSLDDHKAKIIVRKVIDRELWDNKPLIGGLEALFNDKDWLKLLTNSEGFGSGLEEEEIAILMTRKEFSDEVKLKLEGAWFANAMSDDNYGEGFHQLGPKVDESLRNRFIDYALENNPVLLFYSGQLGSDDWEKIKPGLFKVMDAWVNHESVPGYGQPDHSTIQAMIEYGAIPKKQLFDEVEQYSHRLIDSYEKDLARDIEREKEKPSNYFQPDSLEYFERLFLFDGTKVGERARPFAEIAATMKNAHHYFDVGFGYVPEMNDISKEVAKTFAVESIGSPEDFMRYGLLDKPGFEEANQIYAEQNARENPISFFDNNLNKYPQFEEHVNKAQEGISHLASNMSPEDAYNALITNIYSPRKPTDWIYTHPENYSSPADHTAFVEKAMEYIKANKKVKDGDETMRGSHGYWINRLLRTRDKGEDD